MIQDEIHEETLLQRSPDVVWTQHGDQLFFFDADQGMYYGTEATGTRLWELLAQPKTTSVLYRALSAEYDLSVGDWSRDGLAFLKEALASGILQVAVNPTGAEMKPSAG